MPQTRETGAAGRAYGLTMAKGLARLLDAKLLSGGSEARWDGSAVVIKCAGPGTSSVGVTAKMLLRVDAFLAAFEDGHGGVAIWKVTQAQFRGGMYDSKSGVADGRVQMISRTYARKNGVRLDREFTVGQVRAAAQAAEG